jgi:hypothetical protein
MYLKEGFFESLRIIWKNRAEIPAKFENFRRREVVSLDAAATVLPTVQGPLRMLLKPFRGQSFAAGNLVSRHLFE